MTPLPNRGEVPCIVEGCESFYISGRGGAKDMCPKHYRRLYNHGDVHYGESRTIICEMCGDTVPTKMPRRFCVPCGKERAKGQRIAYTKRPEVAAKRAQDARDRRYSRKSELRIKYDMSLDDFDSLVERQDGRCAICENEMRRPCVDHDHRTGRIRGLLCSRCNRGLGLLGDSKDGVEAALLYLTRGVRSGDGQNT